MGRPRSEQAHARVLDAAARLFGDQGIDATSMDAIADAAGVSKATIYKHWPDKSALCLEVLWSLHGDPEPPPRPSADVRADIVAFLCRRPAKTRGDLRARIMPHLMAYAVRRTAFGHLWRQRVIDPQRAQLVALLERAVAVGELSPDLDLEAAAVGLLGPVIYSNLLQRTGGHPPDNLIETIVASLWRAHGVARRRRGVRPAR